MSAYTKPFIKTLFSASHTNGRAVSFLFKNSALHRNETSLFVFLAKLYEVFKISGLGQSFESSVQLGKNFKKKGGRGMSQYLLRFPERKKDEYFY